MPMGLYAISVVGDPTDPSSLIVSGGSRIVNDEDQVTNTIMKLSCISSEICNWEVLTKKLIFPRALHVSIITNKPLNCSIMTF